MNRHFEMAKVLATLAGFLLITTSIMMSIPTSGSLQNNGFLFMGFGFMVASLGFAVEGFIIERKKENLDGKNKT